MINFAALDLNLQKNEINKKINMKEIRYVKFQILETRTL
jgi:hypothetical protein